VLSDAIPRPGIVSSYYVSQPTIERICNEIEAHKMWEDTEAMHSAYLNLLVAYQDVYNGRKERLDRFFAKSVRAVADLSFLEEMGIPLSMDDDVENDYCIYTLVYLISYHPECINMSPERAKDNLMRALRIVQNTLARSFELQHTLLQDRSCTEELRLLTEFGLHVDNI